MPIDHRKVLAKIRRFDQLIAYLRDEMGWPIARDSFDSVDDLFYDFTPEELGIDTKNAAKIQEIKRLRPLSMHQPWGIFFVKFEPKQLPVVALRRILSQVALKKRSSANNADRAAWSADDLLFVSNYGEGATRQISFAHFSQNAEKNDLPTLKVLGWNNLDTALHLDDVTEKLTQRLVWPDDEKDAQRWRERWRSAFTLQHRQVVNTSKTLSVELARLAKNIRACINTVLAIETEEGPISKLMAAFKKSLVHDLDEDGFADMYAQTIAYGLLSARVANPSGDTADDLAASMPVTNPFLKELMETFLHVGGRKGTARSGTGIDFDELGVSDVVELLDTTNMEAVVRDFGDRNPQEDPVIHFYELFLTEYDAKKRMQRGVFYTPRPVVSYIVRSVDELLRVEFGLADGLADTSTWGEMIDRIDGLAVPEGVAATQPLVQILDPATGTGTFLVEVIGLIHKTMTEKWRAEGHNANAAMQLWNDYVPNNLLPRLHGYELMMAPYAIAHLKIGLKLYETGYRFESNQRAKIYLTNALERAQDVSGQFELLMPALAHEAEAVNAIKRHPIFTIVIGNPPYSFTSQNLDESLRAWVEPYRTIEGVPIKEKGALQAEKAIQDDYIKFMRLAQWQITSTGLGIVGLISSHGYLDNPTLRGMRYSYLSSFDSVSILDLHGNTTRKERCPDGSDDSNVFDIRQGVTITLARKTIQSTHDCQVYYAELWGERNSKYKVLADNTSSCVRQEAISPAAPLFLFLPHDEVLREEYEGFPKITEIMPKYGVGSFTSKDHFVINHDAAKLIENAAAFRDSNETDEELCERLGISMKKAWNVTKARERIRESDELASFVRPILYRPFDRRLIFYHPSLVWSMSMPTMQHMLDDRNLAFAIGRAGSAIDQGAWNIVTCSKCITDLNLYRRGGNSLFPLYLIPEEGSRQRDLRLSSQRRLNFSSTFLRSLSVALGIEQDPNGVPANLTPENIFQYTYAVFYSCNYRIRYAEFLKRDFPHLPLTSSLELFLQLANLGSQLVKLHLLEASELDSPITSVAGSGDFQVEKVSYSDETVWIDKTKTQGFSGVPEKVWVFQIGGYQVCEKWLKDRQARGGKTPRPGRVLSDDDIDHYQKVVVAISETIGIMNEIDEVIDEYGGWPDAFICEANDVSPGAKNVQQDLLKVAEEAAEYDGTGD